MPGTPLNVAYLNFGPQSGVTARVVHGLETNGHTVASFTVPGPLEPRDPRTQRLQASWSLALNLLISATRYGRRFLGHRWNTTFAFDFHSSRAQALVDALKTPPDVILQNGALFSPGTTPRAPFVLLLDHTRALSLQRKGNAEAGLDAPLDYGPEWFKRERDTYERAAGIATFSRCVASSLVADYSIDPKKITVVGAGANVFPEQVKRDHDGQTLLFVGRDFRRKGGLVLLRAFEQLRRDSPKARLLIAGPTERLKLPDGAEQLGFVPFESLPALFAQATLFVLPTLREPFGIAFLDAMACGVPCVGTEIEAVPEIINPGETGLLVPPEDDVALARSLNALLGDKVLLEKMGAQSRARVEAKFRWEQVGERLDEALVKAVQRPLGAVEGPSTVSPAR